MSAPEPGFAVKVDLRNPGQFFACCGLLELGHRISPLEQVEGWFDEDTFCVSSSRNSDNTIERILNSLLNTEIDEESRGDATTHPIHLSAVDITLDWWINGIGENSPLKLWAGQQTSLIIVDRLQEALRQAMQDHSNIHSMGLFNIEWPLRGRFGVDPRTAWTTLDVGFSPNEQHIKVATYPAVELLAAVGIQGFRPMQRENSSFQYTAWSAPLPVCVARPASAGLLPAGVVRTYRFRITSRGSYRFFDYAAPIGGGI